MNEMHILINDLTLYGHHGVLEFEREFGQPFLVNADITLSDECFQARDNLEHSLDYSEVCFKIGDYFAGTEDLLLETVADHLADEILDSYPLARAITLSVTKPQAPIPMNFKDVGISVSKEKTRVYLGLGSNMGDCASYLQSAIDALNAVDGIQVIRESKRIVTKPYGKTDQADFLNSVLEIETRLLPRELLQETQRIELENGRVRKEHWGPRTLDIDILFYGDQIISDANLCVPHVDLENRLFVLDSMMELNPYLVHPVLHRRICDLRKEFIL